MVVTSAFESSNPYLEELRATAKYISKRGKGILVSSWQAALFVLYCHMSGSGPLQKEQLQGRQGHPEESHHIGSSSQPFIPPQESLESRVQTPPWY